jgi:replicative DNA helicase
MKRPESVPDLPVDLNAEQFVLGGIFASSACNPEVFEAVAESIHEGMFGLEKNKLIFAAMRAVYTQGMHITRDTVLAELRAKGQDGFVCDGSYFQLTVDCPEVVNLEGHCDAVAECYRQRQLYSKAQDVQARVLARDPAEEIATAAQKSFGEIESIAAKDDALDPEQIIASSGGINVFLSPETETGLMTPWPRLNWITGGFLPGQLIVLGAKPGTGKTSAASNLAIHAAANQHRVRIESYEMLPKHLLFRMTCTHANVDSQEARAGRLHGEDRWRLRHAAGEIVDIKQYLRISASKVRTTGGISAYLRKQRAKGEPVRLLIVDYLQKMRAVGKYERRELEVANCAAALKDLALDHELSVLALSQLRTDAREQFEYPPTMDDFRESKTIGAEADTAIIMRMHDAEQIYKPTRLVNMYLVKQRDGRHGKIPFHFHATYCRYEEIPEPAKEVA